MSPESAGSADGPAPGVVRVAVVDDHPVFRLGMVALLGSLDGIEVAGQAASAAEAFAVVDGAVDVVVMDLHLGGDSGVEVTRELVRRHPAVRVLVVTMLEDDESVVASVRAGARGYLLKGATPGELERAVRAVANGEVILGPQVAARAMTYLSGARTAGAVPFPELTDREREVLDLVAHGLPNGAIATRLFLSEKTVRNRVSDVLTKLHAASRAEAVALARDAGLGPTPGA
jgi:DNA-binding NarL/FixJ family response regulator